MRRLDALNGAYHALGFDRAAGGDEVLRQLAVVLITVLIS